MMPMQKLDGAVRSLPIEVRFAGFKSDTLTLARAGWDLSMRQELNHRHGEPEMQLAMRYEGHGMPSGSSFYAISRAIHPSFYFMRELATSPIQRVIEMLAQVSFDIFYIGNGMRFMVQPVRNAVGAFADSFKAIDAYPSYDEVREERIEDFKFFRLAKPNVKDLIVNPKDVPDLLNLILKAQKPMLERVKKNERSRSNAEQMCGMNFKPAHSVEAQIITMAV